MARQMPELPAQFLGLAEMVTPEIQTVAGSYVHFNIGMFSETVRATLGNEAYTAAWKTGRRMSLDQVILHIRKEMGS
jgi:hypothetical protein